MRPRRHGDYAVTCRSYSLRCSLQARAERLEWEGMSIRQIATELDVPRSTVFGWLRGAA